MGNLELCKGCQMNTLFVPNLDRHQDAHHNVIWPPCGVGKNPANSNDTYQVKSTMLDNMIITRYFEGYNYIGFTLMFYAYPAYRVPSIIMAFATL